MLMPNGILRIRFINLVIRIINNFKGSKGTINIIIELLTIQDWQKLNTKRKVILRSEFKDK